MKTFSIKTELLFLVTMLLFCSGHVQALAEHEKEGSSSHCFSSDPQLDMGEEWLSQPIRYDQQWAKDADLSLTLDQHLYPALSSIINRFASEKKLKIAIKEGTCGISAGLLSKKHVDIGGFCCPPGKMDRLPGLQYHTLGVAALGILINTANPLQNLPTEKIRDLFRGKIKSWSHFSSEKAPNAFQQPVKVIARFHCKQRPGHWRLILDNEELYSLRTDEVASIEDMISRIAGIKGALGYEVLWNIKHYQAAEKVKFLQVGGADPNKGVDVASGRYPFYRVYNITSWGAESGVENAKADALVQYILAHIDEVDPNFGLVPAHQLHQAGWGFSGDELISPPPLHHDDGHINRKP
ncbi:MAG: hypothetical protein QTN59_07185 [Candidatus Electrothrix communis]|nr:hypothetical protein [Desulfobulbus sp. US4]WLE98612.1 MAG: hypothetical protein QTN59_07185 [Candidatus Electrothrix communis]